MKRVLLLSLLSLGLASGPAIGSSSDAWLHVVVEETGEDPGTVNVHLPLTLVEAVVPLVEKAHVQHGRVRIGDGHHEVTAADLRAVWNAAREAKDGEYVRVDKERETVRVSKRGDVLLVHVEQSGGDKERVQIKVPAAFLDALFSGTDDETLDLGAALRSLAREKSGDLVTVEGDSARVRIWIDRQAAGL